MLQLAGQLGLSKLVDDLENSVDILCTVYLLRTQYILPI